MKNTTISKLTKIEINEDAICPNCKHYNAMLFAQMADDETGDEIFSCRDCGFEAIRIVDGIKVNDFCRLNTKELEVLVAVAWEIQACTSGEFGYCADAVTPQGMSRKEFVGYVGSVTKKGLICISDDEFRQVMMTEVGAEFLLYNEAEMFAGKNFDTADGGWVRIPAVSISTDAEILDELNAVGGTFPDRIDEVADRLGISIDEVHHAIDRREAEAKATWVASVENDDLDGLTICYGCGNDVARKNRSLDRRLCPDCEKDPLAGVSIRESLDGPVAVFEIGIGEATYIVELGADCYDRLREIVAKFEPAIKKGLKASASPEANYEALIDIAGRDTRGYCEIFRKGADDSRERDLATFRPVPSTEYLDRRGVRRAIKEAGSASPDVKPVGSIESDAVGSAIRNSSAWDQIRATSVKIGATTVKITLCRSKIFSGILSDEFALVVSKFDGSEEITHFFRGISIDQAEAQWSLFCDAFADGGDLASEALEAEALEALEPPATVKGEAYVARVWKNKGLAERPSPSSLTRRALVDMVHCKGRFETDKAVWLTFDSKGALEFAEGYFDYVGGIVWASSDEAPDAVRGIAERLEAEHAEKLRRKDLATEIGDLGDAVHHFRQIRGLKGDNTKANRAKRKKNDRIVALLERLIDERQAKL